MKDLAEELLTALKDALMWIDAVPQDTQLPTMPGFDRDEVNALIDQAKALLAKPTIDLYQCDGCGHLYQDRVSQCDCMPDVQTFTKMLAVATRERNDEDDDQ